MQLGLLMALPRMKRGVLMALPRMNRGVKEVMDYSVNRELRSCCSPQQTGSCGNVFSSANRDCRDVVVLYKPESVEMVFCSANWDLTISYFSPANWNCRNNYYPGKRDLHW